MSFIRTTTRTTCASGSSHNLNRRAAAGPREMRGLDTHIVVDGLRVVSHQ